MDKIMLGAMTTMSEVGVYENAEKINSLTSGIITALGTVMLPRMTNLAANGKKNESKKYINGSVQNGSSNDAGWTNISIKPTPSKIRRAK